VQITPVTRERLAAEIVELVAARPGRTRVALDGAPPTQPQQLGGQVVQLLRTAGRAALLVAAADFLRPASVRLEYGHTDPDAFLDLRLDVAALRREVLGAHGRVLPRLWDAVADRSYRDEYLPLPASAVVLVAGELLLGRGLPFDLTVHLRMTPAALARRLPPGEHWRLPAYARYDREHTPVAHADLLVLSDHPERPAIGRR